jgi:DNA-binding transcriptional LysR family regulator
MELRHLRHFLAVADALSYSRAAEALHMAASPLSRSIQQLEHDLGGPLFDRGTRRVELTPLGAALVPRARKLLDEVDDITRSVRRQARGQQDILLGTRSVPPTLIRAITEEVIAEAAPAAQVRLQPMESVAQLDEILRGRMALGLVTRRVHERRLDYLEVMQEEPAVALPDRAPFRTLAAVSPEDLTGLRLLVTKGAEVFGSEAQPYLDAVAEVVTTDNSITGALATLIATSDSCCFTLVNPEAPWHRDLAGGGVVIRPLTASLPRAITYLAWRTDRATPDDLGPIIQMARERFTVPLMC